MRFVPDPAVIWAVDNDATQTVVSKQVDQFGNMWLATSAGGSLRCYSPAGALLQDYNHADLFNLVIEFNYANQVGPATWPLFSSGFYYTYHTVLNDGATSYVVQFAIANNSTLYTFNSVSVFAIAADGALTLEGGVWQLSPVPPSAIFSTLTGIDLCNNKTFDDPLFTWQEHELGGCWGTLWPAINTIRANCQPAATVNYGFIHDALGNTGLNTSLGSTSGRTATIFLMPEGDETQVFLYVSRATMQSNHTSGLCPWMESDLYPTYPAGVMVKASMGVVTEPALITTLPGPAGAALVPAAAPGCFIDTNGDPYDAFADVATNWDGTGSRGNVDYFAAPAPLTRDFEGNFQVGWYRPQFGDDTYAGADWPFYVRAKIQSYSSATGLFTDEFQFSQRVADITDFGTAFGAPTDNVAIVQFAMFWSGGQLYVLNVDGTPATGSARNRTWLARLGRLVTARFSTRGAFLPAA